jgi:hypothetical protein
VALDADLDVIRTWVLGTPISDGGGSSPPG